jgi:hypothetical protein
MSESPRDVHLFRMWLLVIAVLHWVCFFLMVHTTPPRKSADAPLAPSNYADAVGPGSNTTASS